MLSYDPGEVYRCCQHNHAMGWPYYAEHLWMATADNGLAAVFYNECEVTAKVGSGATVRLTEETEYPFAEQVKITVHLDKPTKFPIYLRAPSWCGSALAAIGDKDGRQVGLGGSIPKATGQHASWDRIDRTWHDGDTIQLELQMQVETRTWSANKDSMSVRRGPLWYSLRIGEADRPYGPNKDWPGIELYPASPWNYGLVIHQDDPTGSFKFVRSKKVAGDQPWTMDSAPVLLQAQAKRIPGWQQDRRGLVGALQASPVRSAEAQETVTLVPMGAARLRISAFPVIGDGPSAHDWAAPAPTRHEASFEHDDIDAVSDGKEPKNSGDHAVPRFTWWDHRGTTEWITTGFDKPRRVSGTSVYWFDDTGIGRCRVPASWKLFYRDGDTWREVQGAGPYGVQPDQYNQVRFEPVTTSALKIEVRLQDQMSGGILEWKIDGAK